MSLLYSRNLTNHSIEQNKEKKIRLKLKNFKESLAQVEIKLKKC